MDAKCVDEDDRNKMADGCKTDASQLIDWYGPGESRTVEVGDIRVGIRLVERKGRRARIAITAPAGAVFRDSHPGESDRSPESSGHRALDATSDNREIAR